MLTGKVTPLYSPACWVSLYCSAEDISCLSREMFPITDLLEEQYLRERESVNALKYSAVN